MYLLITVSYYVQILSAISSYASISHVQSHAYRLEITEYLFHDARIKIVSLVILKIAGLNLTTLLQTV
jgi:hypothetical protein